MAKDCRIPALPKWLTFRGQDILIASANDQLSRFNAVLQHLLSFIPR